MLFLLKRIFLSFFVVFVLFPRANVFASEQSCFSYRKTNLILSKDKNGVTIYNGEFEKVRNIACSAFEKSTDNNNFDSNLFFSCNPSGRLKRFVYYAKTDFIHELSDDDVFWGDNYIVRKEEGDTYLINLPWNVKIKLPYEEPLNKIKESFTKIALEFKDKIFIIQKSSLKVIEEIDIKPTTANFFYSTYETNEASTVWFYYQDKNEDRWIYHLASGKKFKLQENMKLDLPALNKNVFFLSNSFGRREVDVIFFSKNELIYKHIQLNLKTVNSVTSLFTENGYFDKCAELNQICFNNLLTEESIAIKPGTTQANIESITKFKKVAFFMLGNESYLYNYKTNQKTKLAKLNLVQPTYSIYSNTKENNFIVTYSEKANPSHKLTYKIGLKTLSHEKVKIDPLNQFSYWDPVHIQCTNTLPDLPKLETDKKSPIYKNQNIFISTISENLENMCHEDFASFQNSKVWSVKKTKKLSLKNTITLIHRFQKPGGFVPRTDFPIYMSMLKNDYAKIFPVEFEIIRYNIKRLDILANLPSFQTTLNPASLLCLGKDNETGLKNAILQISESVANGSENRFFDFSKILGTLDRQILTLKKAEKELLLYEITSVIADRLTEKTAFEGIFRSKLYKFIENQLKPAITGKKKKNITDLTIVRKSGGDLDVLILASHPIELLEFSGKRSSLQKPSVYFGIYYLLLERVQINELESKNNTANLKWKSGNKEFAAKYTSKLSVRGSVCKKSLSPKYDEFLADKKLTGLTLTSVNLHEIEGGVLNSHKSYFRSSGFHLEPKFTVVKSMKKFIQEKIESGEVDYLLKEAHSDGDEKNVVRIAKVGRLTVGQKEASSGNPAEKVYLITGEKNTGDELISNEEFAEWFDERQRRSPTQLLYVNGSCHSYFKAQHELSYMKNDLLEEIASSQTAYTLTDSQDSEIKQIFDSIRAQKTYQEMEKKDFRKLYLFPFQDKYQRDICEAVEKPVLNSIEILDQQGKPYALDATEK